MIHSQEVCYTICRKNENTFKEVDMNRLLLKAVLLTFTAGLMFTAAPFPAAAAAAPQPEVKTKTYRVQKGDTFWKISRRMNIPLDLLLKANSRFDPYNLPVGAEISLPKAKSAAAFSAQDKTWVTAGGETLAYKRKLTVKASAYTASAGENGGYGAVDYFGNPLRLGTIAVDPNTIPFGSKLYITGYQFGGLPQGGFIGKASDTGGAVKGNRIDIFIPTTQHEAKTFGIQNVTVYVLN
jgi:3D (Asp-Asp-Asp) domain-containing protein